MTIPSAHFMSIWNFRAEQGLRFKPFTARNSRHRQMSSETVKAPSKIPVTLRIPAMIEFLYDES